MSPLTIFLASKGANGAIATEQFLQHIKKLSEKNFSGFHKEFEVNTIVCVCVCVCVCVYLGIYCINLVDLHLLILTDYSY